jgi:hypothetical protein
MNPVDESPTGAEPVPTYTNKTVKNKVYLNCWNKADVTVVQELLNPIPVNWGGASYTLPVNGVCDAKTVEAIKGVQRRYFAFEDGVIDATNSMTLQILNDMNRHLVEKPRPANTPTGGDVAPPVAVQKQDAQMRCWATAMAMLQTWWYGEPWTPWEAADAAGGGYGARYEDKTKGLDANVGHVKGFIEALGYRGLDHELTDDPNTWWPVLHMQPVAVMLRKSWGYHVRVAYGLKTDGTLYGTSVHIADPDGPKDYWESWHKFVRLYKLSDGMAGVRVWGA